MRMKQFIRLLALLLAAFVWSSSAAQAREWQHFGADHAYKTRAAAIADAPHVLKQRGYSDKVIAAFKQAMTKRGTRARVTNGDHLAWMRSGPSAVWTGVLVKFTKPPVARMEYAAPSEEWTVVVDGISYTIGLPAICNNLYGRPPPEDDCGDLSFDAPVGGHVRWGIATINGPMPPSACNAQREGTGNFNAWYGECDECVPAEHYIHKVMGERAVVPHKYYYPVTQTHQTIRFSRAVWAKMVYVCLEDANGRRTCGVYVPPNGHDGGWNSRKHVPIPDSFWVWDESACPE